MAAIGIALLLFLIIKVRLQPFVALLGVSIAVGLMAGLSVTELFGTVQKSDAVSTIESGMGGILGHVAIIIGLGTMLGAILEVSGGAEVLAKPAARAVRGEAGAARHGPDGPHLRHPGLLRRRHLRPRADRLRGRQAVRQVGPPLLPPLLIGLSVTHAFLPPHPGPVAAAGLLHVDLGWVILMGVVCGLPAVVAAWVYSAWIGKRIFVAVPQDMVEAAQEAKEAVAAEQRASGVRPRETPVPLGTVLGIIGTPLLLILAATFSSIALDESTLRSVIEFFGHPFVALTLALFLAYYLLGIRRGWSRKSLETVSTSSLKPVGNILLVVGAGGVFGAVLKGSGVAQALSDTFNDVGLPVIVLSYLISVVLRVAQGSATVAIVTTAGIVAPLLSEGDHSQAFVALVIMAISAGSIFASHVNDGGFWMVAKYFGISERDTLKSWTVLESVLSVAGFVVAAALSLVV